MTTCDDQQVPKQATGKTPVRNARIPDEDWLPLLAKAELEGRTATDALAAAARRYWTDPAPGAYDLTFSNWPQAAAWLQPESAFRTFEAMDAELSEALGWSHSEYLTVAAWLAATRHPRDAKEQARIIAGHILRDIPRDVDAAWWDRFRDRRHLTETILAILGRHLPLGED